MHVTWVIAMPWQTLGQHLQWGVPGKQWTIGDAVSEGDSREWWKGLSEVRQGRWWGKLSELHRFSLVETPCPSPFYPWFLTTSLTQPVLTTASGGDPKYTDMWKSCQRHKQVWFQSGHWSLSGKVFFLLFFFSVNNTFIPTEREVDKFSTSSTSTPPLSSARLETGSRA